VWILEQTAFIPLWSTNKFSCAMRTQYVYIREKRTSSVLFARILCCTGLTKRFFTVLYC